MMRAGTVLRSASAALRQILILLAVVVGSTMMRSAGNGA
jgi:hypothetical protein